ncbi:hypothetical protein HYPSUDRAFT_59300 [Hypholoma sublateritium FD-334 SS-4]|uniref:Uncharacterized protein n=1 Tax=Hypholoma sublateritium (strain FD-334 SS-4) TaxID=945553 RepID=A0A0D2NDB3_HYPSF|nr:hypothetical protein HYPSUDRAFT_59300 [Hypholoma sublateritium FD-334 SS-4]
MEIKTYLNFLQPAQMWYDAWGVKVDITMKEYILRSSRRAAISSATRSSASSTVAVLVGLFHLKNHRSAMKPVVHEIQMPNQPISLDPLLEHQRTIKLLPQYGSWTMLSSTTSHLAASASRCGAPGQTQDVYESNCIACISTAKASRWSHRARVLLISATISHNGPLRWTQLGSAFPDIWAKVDEVAYLRMANDQKATTINSQAATIHYQKGQLRHQSNQHDIIIEQMMYFRGQIEIRDVELNGWKSIGHQLEAWNNDRTGFLARHDTLRRDFDEHVIISEKMLAIQHDVHATDNANNNATIARLSETISRLENELHALGAEVDGLNGVSEELTAELNVIYQELKTLETWTMNSDPVAFLKIRFRRLIDEAIRFLFEALTGKKADDRHRNVKSWWSSVLNPSNSRHFNPQAQYSPQQLDDIRFQMCLTLLSDSERNFKANATYKNLVNSGTLKYLTQSSIPLRNEGNFHAHELLDASGFRKSLAKAKSDNIIESICTESDYSSLEGLINFVEASQIAP